MFCGSVLSIICHFNERLERRAFIECRNIGGLHSRQANILNYPQNENFIFPQLFITI